MKLSDLKTLLGSHPTGSIRFVLPDGRLIGADFHVTEVGHVTKTFIDCGGTVRSSQACMLQVWRAENDAGHRLNAGKLGGILELSRKVVPSDDLEVEVEYEDIVISQYPVDSFGATDGILEFKLGTRHTDCLAREACGLDSQCCGDSGCN